MTPPDCSTVCEMTNRPITSEKFGTGIDRRAFAAAGSLKALGGILSAYHSGNITGLNRDDLEGISLAIESLGHYMENLCDDSYLTPSQPGASAKL